MKLLALSILACLIGTTLYAGDQKELRGKTFTFTVPGDVEAKSPEDNNNIPMQWESGQGTTIFVITSMRLNNASKVLASQADTMEQALEAEFKKQFSELQKNRKEIQLASFKGIELEFILKHASGLVMHYVHFYLSDGAQMLHGQLTAHSPNDKEKAHAILRSAKLTTK